MDFLKKNYEKILLGLALLGLVAALALLVLLVSNEQQKQEERRNRIFTHRVEPLAPPDLSQADALLTRTLQPDSLDFSSTNKLFNPVRWQRALNGQLIKNPAGEELKRLEIVTNTPLYLTVELERVMVSPDGQLRFEVAAEQQAARAGQRGWRRTYMSVGDKKDLGALSLTLREAKGDTNNAVLTLELSDTGERLTVSNAKPFRRLDGYMTTLKYPPENRLFTNERQNDVISFAGEDYKIVAIHRNEVVLSALSNQKKWTVKSNPAP